MMLINQINKLPKEILDLVYLAGDIAHGKNYRAFLVGGFVRDFILGLENIDLDIVIEGDGIDFSSLLAGKLKARLIRHPRFGTATVVAPDKFKIDIATARREFYQNPAALPQVEFGSLKDDLARRDFTINAMAVDISQNNFGQLVDFFRGQEDIKTKRIRILHNISFIDDPTRILRAVRFEQRYGFRIEPHTLRLLKDAVSLKMLHKTQEQRLRDEFTLILKEPKPIKCIKRLDSLCMLSFIHRHLYFNLRIERLLYAIEKNINWFRVNFPKKRSLDAWLIYLMGLFDGIAFDDLKDICQRFAFHKGDRLRIMSYKKDNLDIIKRLCNKNITASGIYRILEPVPYEVIILILAKSKDRLIHKRIKDFLLKYNGMRISVSGRDLSNLDLQPGPKFKKILNSVLYAKINGKIRTKQEELEFLKNRLNDYRNFKVSAS